MHTYPSYCSFTSLLQPSPPIFASWVSRGRVGGWDCCTEQRVPALSFQSPQHESLIWRSDVWVGGRAPVPGMGSSFQLFGWCVCVCVSLGLPPPAIELARTRTCVSILQIFQFLSLLFHCTLHMRYVSRSLEKNIQKHFHLPPPQFLGFPRQKSRGPISIYFFSTTLVQTVRRGCKET